jgi:hypothetical protein
METYYPNEVRTTSYCAVFLLCFLARRGGSARLSCVLSRSGLSREELRTTINHLHGRRWIKLAWHSPRDGVRGRMEDVARVTITRFGRSRASQWWQRPKQ